MNRGLHFILACLVLLASCHKDPDGRSPDGKSGQSLEADGKDDFLDIFYNYIDWNELKHVTEVRMYIAHPLIRSSNALYCYEPERSKIETKTKEHIDDEDAFREFCDYVVILRDDPMDYVCSLLYNAQPAEYKRQEVEREDRVQGGMIIDVCMKDGSKRVFVMDNDGQNLFYEKGKEGEYYKMPEVLLEKFHLSYFDTITELKGKHD